MTWFRRRSAVSCFTTGCRRCRAERAIARRVTRQPVHAYSRDRSKKRARQRQAKGKRRGCGGGFLLFHWPWWPSPSQQLIVLRPVTVVEARWLMTEKAKNRKHGRTRRGRMGESDSMVEVGTTISKAFGMGETGWRDIGMAQVIRAFLIEMAD
ncbi:hypothetical protein IQ07DRAFT_285599 [Pyrenochaeta sp. DS3sAY3a]|nr:hypothetical protein IQ07DRAFT_285599 [Pyrenochaeta sp. DS3sAY3a]